MNTPYKIVIGNNLPPRRPRPDFTELPMCLSSGLAYGLEGESTPRHVYWGPDFYKFNPEKAINLGWLESPHEYCLITALEFARRYPDHKWSEYWRKNPEFTDDEIIEICKGRKKLIFEYYDPPGQENDLKISFLEPRPDFSKEPLVYLQTYCYWLEGDNLKGEPRSRCHRSVFSRIPIDMAEEREWVSGDNEYSLIANLEFYRRNPNHKDNKDIKSDFSNKEILDIAKGKKKIKFFYEDKFEMME